MLAILAPLLVFGLVIFVHELGHFIAAKAMGVYAPRFSIGFGPALFRRRRGETEYVLAAFPLGGYVRMASRLDAEVAFLEGGSEEENAKKQPGPDWDPEAMIPHGPKPVPENRWFESKSLPARLLIMIAGVVMNFVLAFVVAVSLTLWMGRVVVRSTTIGNVTPVAALPELGRLQPGDRIIAVNGTAVQTWNDVRRQIAQAGDSVAIRTASGEVAIPLTGEGRSAAAVANAIDYQVPPVIDMVVPNSRAAEAGFVPGDSVVTIDGSPVRDWSEMLRVVGAAPNRKLTVTVVRGGAERMLIVTPKDTTIRSPTSGADSVVGRVGAAPKVPTSREQVGPAEAVSAGARMTAGMTAAVVDFLRQLFVGQVSVKELGGPIAITSASVTAARSGIEDLFYLIAFLSINVAVLNLLPIPILDGGQIVINIIESAKGSPFSLRTREYILRAGLVVIGLLFITVMFNDTRGLIGRLFGG
jgi:regulator of sigma E protease